MGRIRVGIVGVLAAVGVLLPGCAGAPSSTAGMTCAWQHKADKVTNNIAYPDTNAEYWVLKYELSGGQRILIDGTYPSARYFSFVTYDGKGAIIDSETDRDIAPDPGSFNPFSDPLAPINPATRKYHATIESFVGSSAPGDNTLGTGAAVLGHQPGLVMRVYTPDNPADFTGGVGLPAIRVQSADGSIVSVATCPTQTADLSVNDLLAFGPATDQPALTPPRFGRPVTTEGLFANPDNKYVAAVTAHTPGQVVVVRGTAPTTPDTRAGQSPTLPTDLRYWSLCSNLYSRDLGYPVVDCVGDADVPLDGGDQYTFVISTVADRPANATLANGVVWLDWGSTAVNGVLIMRNMLPAATFHQSTFDVAPGQPAATAMGVYTPTAVYCSSATFAGGGAAACGI